MSRTIISVALFGLAVAFGSVTAAPVPPVKAPSDEQERLLARGKKFIERGQIDLFLVASAAWAVKGDDLRLWEPASDFGRGMIERAGMTGDRKPQGSPSSYKSFAAFLSIIKPDFKRMNEPYLRLDPNKAIPPAVYYPEAIQAPGVTDPTGIADCLVLSNGNVRAALGIQHSVVFATGDVTARTALISVVIVCDGDVTVTDGRISQSVIVARGNIIASSDARCAVLMAGGTVQCVYGPRGAPKGGDANVIVEKKPNTLGITFFELHRVGIEAKAAEKVVTLTAIKAGSAAARAGLKVGDVVAAVGAKKPTDPESLRRALRDALALGDAALTVTRDGKPVQVKLALPE